MPTFAPNFQYVEDTPHVSGDRGTATLVVRKDSATSLADTDGDYTILQVDASGNLRIVGTVQVGNLPAVQPVSDNGGSLTVDGTVSVTQPVAVTDNAGSLTVDGTVSVSNFPAVQPVSDNAGSLTVDAVDLDIRNLSTSQDAVRIGYTRDPAWLGVYSWRTTVFGVAAANTFVSIFNPAGSGRNMVFLSAVVETMSVAISTATNTFRLSRITAASAGTVVTDFAKWRTADSAPAVVIRNANPTITAGNTIVGFLPNAQVTAAGSTSVSTRAFTPDITWGEFVCAEGEGVAFHQTTGGDTDQVIAVTIVWAER